ncbi:MAG: DEAD/DEAH box helicase family protein [Clostridia bacterium]|nr:DEAD/DEAH box helicase family protein [Clostridia bacterium]
MLQDIIDLQQNAVQKLFEQLKVKDELTFRAPTGSGKTYMMADLMNKVLSENDDVVFLVSTLSKGDLATQNYEKFCQYKDSGNFSYISPYLINSDISGEERLFIPTNFNVYLLPRDLYKKGGRLMQGAMENFLMTLTLSDMFGGLNKKIYLIKDECHIATNNLDTLSESIFSKVLNFSATPSLKRGQNPDVEITDDEAVNAKLIKHIELGDDNETVADAICKFEEVKDSYRNLLGVNPCLIIQISNKEKADYELNNVIFPELNKAEHQDLKWMLIVDDPKNCNTNDVFKAKKLPVNKWKDYAKENTSTIDIIIFKMVISEGWDIPRACMLYQVRNSQSEQLDEQVMGRVRRNPRLLDFEELSSESQNLATTAWIWGVLPPNKKKVYGVKLYDEPTDIINNLKLKTTQIKKLTAKKGFDIEKFIDNQPNISQYSNIFSLYKKLRQSEFNIQEMCYEYANDYSKWWKFNENLDKIKRESESFNCDYENSMAIACDELGNEIETSFAIESTYVDNGNYVNISDWVWKRKNSSDKFSFDSEAEREWASFLKDLASNDNTKGVRIAKRIVVGKKNPNYGKLSLFETSEPEKLNPEQKYLWGKNYIPNSKLKFEYYMKGIHSSYPDFILKDSYDRVHIFEVKSVNISNATPAMFDSMEYKIKMEELKRCYKQASKLTGYYFYLPVLKEDVWYITQLYNGNERNLTKDQFLNFIRNNEDV